MVEKTPESVNMCSPTFRGKKKNDHLGKYFPRTTKSPSAITASIHFELLYAFVFPAFYGLELSENGNLEAYLPKQVKLETEKYILIKIYNYIL